ncbi:glycerophosphodiester phosphodiesterase [Fusobacterium necrophorum]|uniref:glycerophosphodiester phosphodiesterase n=1 Tax=Fusobacterium necrophorum TaxID=859 RepID=UPI00078913EE|nr:glycerophosphodiester phosphodiesterase [Fusobacterium necrophorum]KYM44467.1 glycerophosphodiester phosphodiesterase [Fusobacterium necrophorum subsp. funduliforme]
MKVFAHRGASGYAPENTLAAIKKAIEQGADGIEIDIQFTKDCKIVVFHDWKINRTSNGKGYVYDLNFEELRALEIGSWYGDEYRKEKIPTLEEILELIPENMMLNIEIKDISRGHRGIEESMLKILKKFPNLKNNIIVSSFHHSIIQRLQELAPEIKLALLTASDLVDIESYFKNNKLDCFSYHPEVNLITSKTVDILHKMGVKVFVWTINTEEDFLYVHSIGVDGIITNYPDIMKKFVIKYKE